MLLCKDIENAFNTNPGFPLFCKVTSVRMYSRDDANAAVSSASVYFPRNTVARICTEGEVWCDR